MIKKMYQWVVLQDGEIVSYGVEDTSIERFVERIFPKAFTTVDRDLSSMQEYADKYLSEYNYIFNYKEIEIDFSDLMKEE